MNLFIDREADRLEVAAILVKNGYRVRQGKLKRGTRSTYTYYLEVDGRSDMTTQAGKSGAGEE